VKERNDFMTGGYEVSEEGHILICYSTFLRNIGIHTPDYTTS